MKAIVAFFLFLTALSLVFAQEPLYESYVIKGGDLEATVLNVGAVIQRLYVPNRYGEKIDIVLGYNDTTEQYLNTKTYFGAAVGRVANRIANGTFELDGEEYKITLNENPVDKNGEAFQTLHGGKEGWSVKLWSWYEKKEDSVTLQLISEDGDQGFPGEVDVKVTYHLTKDNELNVTAVATTTKLTPINFAQHSYFNLDGHNAGTAKYHYVQIHADAVTPTDVNNIPTGEIQPIADSGYDLRTPRQLYQAIAATPNASVGFDINYVLVPEEDFQDNYIESPLRKAVNAWAPASGIFLELSTNQPGVQFYNGGQLDNEPGKDGIVYQKFGTVVFEAQTFPDYVNQKNFPQNGFYIEPGQEYVSKYFYNFSTFDTWPYGLY